MDLLWSASTTMRNPERTMSFLKTAAEIEGAAWCDETQMKYQVLLIKNRYYTPTARNLPPELFALLQDYSHDLTYEEAAEIFARKQYVDGAMRGRTSFDPLEKLGLACLDDDGAGLSRIKITEFGKMFLEGKIDLGEMVFSSLLKAQYPNPLEDGRDDYNIKPFIGCLHLIKMTNGLCVAGGQRAVGISREEFGIFVLSLKSYLHIDDTAKRLLDFREKKRSLPNDRERNAFVSDYIAKFLSAYQNPERNIREYTDNVIRYLRLTKYIYIRGGGYYIDLEPRRMIEIDAILAQDAGEAKAFTLDEYKRYISDYCAYTLPFETEATLRDVAAQIVKENARLSATLGFSETAVALPSNAAELTVLIDQLRERRTSLQNLLIMHEFQASDKIDEAIGALEALLSHRTPRGSRPSVELEKWVNIALNIVNDATLIKPNAPLGDDNEPTFTAPANVPDIECYYVGFGAICEVTMLTGRNQWYSEGQPVMRHLRSFEAANDEQSNYCLFVAPRLHVDTINTFWAAVKYEYEGKPQKIIPLTVTGLIDVLRAVRNIKAGRRTFNREDLRLLYDRCVDVSGISDSTKWGEHIRHTIEVWSAEIAQGDTPDN